MVSFQQLVSLQTTVVLLMTCGFLLKKLHIIKSENEKCLSDLVMLVFMPASIVYSFSTELTLEILWNGASILVIAFLIQFFAMGVNKFVYNTYPREERCIYQYGTLVSNGGLVGIPIINGLFGGMGVLYANIYLIPQRIFIWSAGLSLFTEQKGDWKTSVKRTVTNPTVLAIVIGLLPSVFHTSYPHQVLETLRYIGNCLSAMSLIVVGAMLADVQWKGLFSKGIAHISINRLFVIPLIVLFACRLGGVEEQITWISVLLVGMPVASTCAALARKYDQDYILASKTILVTTILSVVTLPVLSLF